MGRRPKPDAEKQLTGASRRKKAPIATPSAMSSHLRPPGWMTGREAKTVWHRIVPELQRFNALNESFRDALGRYCVHMAEWIRLTKEIRRDGTTMMVKMTHSEERMPRLNPSIRVRETIEKSLLDLEDRFGISPLARYRIIAHQAANPQRDLFASQSTAAAPTGEKMPPPDGGKTSPVGILRSALN